MKPLLPLRLLFLVLLAAVASRLGAAATLETDRLRITLGEGGALSVVDKAAGAHWSQPALPLRVGNVRTTATELTFSLNEVMTVRIVPAGARLDLEISGPEDATIEGLEYPAGFTQAAASAGQNLVLPHCAGFSIPFAMKERPDLARVSGYYTTDIGQGGLTMPWIATTDGKAGCLMLVGTPYDSRMKVWTDAAGYQYAVGWHNTMGRFGYTRRVSYLFTAAGGAVALCKAYREEARSSGLLVTLREKRKSIPALDRFLGAISLWLVDWPDAGLIERIKAAGVDRALVSYHVTGPVPPGVVNRYGHNTTYEAMDRKFTDHVHALGFLAGRYDYYRTIYPPGDDGRGGNGWIMRFIGYPEQLAHDEKGRIRPGFQGGNQRGEPAPGTAIRGNRCSKCQYEMAQAYIPVDVDRTGYDARLLDAVCAVNWQECYNPSHPVTREEDMQWRRRQLQVAMDNGQVTGTEHISSWAVPHAVYAEAPTTFVRFAGYRESFNGRSFAPPESFTTAVLDERIRFPLWQLVFHDAVVITNRWTFTANRYTDEKIWDKEDLINLLHGQMPTFMLDAANFEAKAAHFARTAQTVGRWNAKIGYEEMTDFRWLNPAGTVQEAVYGSGDSVVVNFGPDEQTLPDGLRVPAGGFAFRATAR
jgi:hypothetical protein